MTQNEILISIIIPTYNVEKYIGECLDSLLKQTFEHFEIIIIDDLSTDSTEKIIQNYMQKDQRIKFLKNEYNSGPGISRNNGMKIAKGKYIQFIDGDDWLDLNTLERVYNYAEQYDAQMVMFKGIHFDDKSNLFYKDEYFSISCLSNFEDKLFSFDVITDELFKIFVGPVNKLYLRSFLEDIAASFPENRTHEDNPFFYQVFCESKRIYLTNEYFYNRRVWNGSVSTLRDDTELETVDVVEKILNVFLNNGLYDKFKELLLNRLLFKLRNRYTLVGDDFKEEYFLRAKIKLNKFMVEYDLRDDLVYCLRAENKKFFENLVYSNSFEEFVEGL